MTKLHQLLAVERDVRHDTNRRITDGYHTLQREAALQGLERSYQPKAEDGDTLPPESKRVQVNAADVLAESKDQFVKLWDLVATKDVANTKAVADVVTADGTVLATGVPATHLLWLEKELNDLHTILSKVPTLDPSENWTHDPASGVWKSATVQTHRTTKTPTVLTKAPATDKHPAQVEVFMKDEVVGYWSTTKFSGALPADEVRDLLDRVATVRDAVKVARSKANEYDVEPVRIAKPILDFIFDGPTA